MELYFHAENQIQIVQHGLHAALNLLVDAAVWFRVWTVDLMLGYAKTCFAKGL